MINILKGYAGAYITYPLAELVEKRKITEKVKELDKFYNLDFKFRKVYVIDKLIETLNFAKITVPYYRDLFKKINFDPNSLLKDIKYLQDVPYLTKEIINEQNGRMLSAPLSEVRYYERKTGGSTGVSTMIYYDQIGLDYSAAITRYCRKEIGHDLSSHELHFAASFAKPEKSILLTKDNIKNFALNRSNIFFDRLDSIGLDNIWQMIKKTKPYLIHGHPSTLYALACFLESKKIKKQTFQIFESSGELLQEYMKDKIESVFGCSVINRYGSAEFGVIAYEINGHRSGLKILESEGWAENYNEEFVFTGFHNRLMPLIRYRTGDNAKVVEKNDGSYMTEVFGRVHDIIIIDGIEYPTHAIMDILDHKVGGIQEFQIDMRNTHNPKLRVSIDGSKSIYEIKENIEKTWLSKIQLEFVEINEFVRVGHHAKFRHVIK